VTEYAVGVGRTGGGVSDSGMTTMQSLTNESLLGQGTISAWDSVRLHPRPWMWFWSAVEAVPRADMAWQQQHLRFVAFTRGHSAFWRPPPGRALSQQAPEQQQAFESKEMPRQNSLRCPSGQTH
jgi:hypothetical protein